MKRFATSFLALAACTSLPAQTLTTLYSLTATDGSAPNGLVQGTDGNFYGTTQAYHGILAGTVFKIDPRGAFTTLYNFCSQPNCADGQYPIGSLVLGTDGNFYGTTSQSGRYDGGTIFKITPGGVLTTLYNFCALMACADGMIPQASLLQAVNGDFYGIALQGGAHGDGALFKITPAGKFTTLYSFCSQPACADGLADAAALIQAANGELYGTTSGRTTNTGKNGVWSTIFSITERGMFSTFYDFCGADSCTGILPTALVQAPAGEFYGATTYGGAIEGGTLFKLSPGGTLTTLYNFCAKFSHNACWDGNLPVGLIAATDGSFYGATLYGGAHALNYGGALFRITEAGDYSLLYSFCSLANCADGAWPAAAPVEGTDGNFYGTTFEGGGECVSGAPHSCGTVYRLSLGLAPFIRALPHSGKIGDTISILGTNLTGTTAVAFHGAPATFTVVSPTQITATVPAGATTGAIQVTMPSGTLSSAGPFLIH